jgi:hypothetical protein
MQSRTIIKSKNGVGKKRSTFTIDEDVFDRWTSIVPEKEHSLWIERTIREWLDEQNLNPGQVQRKKVLRQLREAHDKLTNLLDKIKKTGTRESRLAEIAAYLGNLDEKKGPLGVYDNLKGDWDLIRFQAVEDLKGEPEWVVTLKITEELEVDEACDLAQEIDTLKQAIVDLGATNRILRGKVANPDQADEGKEPEPEPSPAPAAAEQTEAQEEKAAVKDGEFAEFPTSEELEQRD